MKRELKLPLAATDRRAFSHGGKKRMPSSHPSLLRRNGSVSVMHAGDAPTIADIAEAYRIGELEVDTLRRWDAAFEIRAIFSDAQGRLIEDPVCGSLNAPVGQWLFASGRARGGSIASQDAGIGRTGRIRVMQDAQGQVRMDGRTAMRFEG